MTSISHLNLHYFAMNWQDKKTAFVSFLSDEEGATAVEYAVMLGLILAVCIVAMAFLGTQNRNSFEDSASRISGAVN